MNSLPPLPPFSHAMHYVVCTYICICMCRTGRDTYVHGARAGELKQSLLLEEWHVWALFPQFSPME
jgi:hypothetical protein